AAGPSPGRARGGRDPRLGRRKRERHERARPLGPSGRGLGRARGDVHELRGPRPAAPPGRRAARPGAARVGDPGPHPRGARRRRPAAARGALVPGARGRDARVRGPQLPGDRRRRPDGARVSLAADLGIAFGRVAFVMLFVLNMGGLLTWVERKQSAIMQDRIGANRASIMGVIMVYGSLNMMDIVRGQGTLLWGWLPAWGIVTQPLAFVLFLTAGIAATKRIPFDMPEGESEIIGYFVEYSGMKFGMFAMADFLETVVIAGMTTSLFLGGWQVPYLAADGFRFPWGGAVLLPHLLVVLLQVGAF